MNRLTVFIPGIMGSALRLSKDGREDLWSEQILTSVEKLVGDPALYQPSPNIAVEPNGILEEVLLLKVPFPLYKSLRKEMGRLRDNGLFHYDEFAYDWRQDLINTARQFGTWLNARHGFRLDEQGHQLEEREPRLAVVGHSMGCLVYRFIE